MNITLKHAIAGLGVFFLQLTFVPLISLGDYVPDVLLLWLVVVGIRSGHVEATLLGFGAGLLQDATTTQLFGLAALSKSIAGFAAGYFFNENTSGQTLGSYRLILTSAVIGMAHNLVYFGIFYQGLDVPFIRATLQSSLGTALYTSVVAVLPMFAFSRTYHTQWTQ